MFILIFGVLFVFTNWKMFSRTVSLFKNVVSTELGSKLLRQLWGMLRTCLILALRFFLSGNSYSLEVHFLKGPPAEHTFVQL
jgi:hypothetical protein